MSEGGWQLEPEPVLGGAEVPVGALEPDSEASGDVFAWRESPLLPVYDDSDRVAVHVHAPSLIARRPRGEVHEVNEPREVTEFAFAEGRGALVGLASSEALSGRDWQDGVVVRANDGMALLLVPLRRAFQVQRLEGA